MANNFLFDLFAPFYDRVIGERDPELLKGLLKLPTDSLLLDLGGGTGRVSSSLLPWINGLVICDLSFPMLLEAQEKGIACLLQGSSTKLPFSSNSFERILVVDALHHFSDQPGSIKELIRVLKPGGYLLIEEPDIHKFSVKLVALLEKAALMRSHFHTGEEIKRFAEKFGASAEVVYDEDFAVWVIIEK